MTSEQNKDNSKSVSYSGPLAAGEQTVRMLFDLMPQLGWAAKPDGYVDFYNAGWYEYTGTTFEEMAGWGWEKVHDTSSLPQFREQWKQAIATQSAFEAKIQLRRKDGAYRWFLMRVNPIRDADEKLIGWVGISSDIHNEFEQANLLSASERQFRLLTDRLPDIVWIIDQTLKCSYLNQRFYDYTGLPAGKGLSDEWHETVHPDDLQRIINDWQIAHETKTEYQNEQRIKAADGTYRWFLVRGVPLIDELGDVISWFGTATDIHHRKQSRSELERLVTERTKELADAKSVTESILQAISDAIIISDVNGALTYVNEAAKNLYGTPGVTPATLAEAASMGRLCSVNGGALLTTEELPISQSLLGHAVNDAEVSVRLPNSERMFSVAARPLKNAAGEINGAVAALRDITARKAQEQALEKARDEAIRANTLKSEFVANISHEIRTPMSGILGFTELLTHETEGVAQETANHILFSARSLMGLVNDLLDLSKLEAGKMEIRNERFQIEVLVDDVLTAFYVAASNKKLKLVATVEDSVKCDVIGDGNRVRQVLLNLVQNAIKFTEEGSIEVAVRLQRQENKVHCVRFSVIDSGEGISSDDQKKLFQLFVQVDGSSTRRHGGSGLGLALCKRMVELMGGTIGVESSEGTGSTFWFELPLDVAEPLALDREVF